MTVQKFARFNKLRQYPYLVEIDGDIMARFLDADLSSIKFELGLGGKSFVLHDVRIIRATAPVTARTERGGAYFSDAKIFRMLARIGDRRIVPLISGAMLGPSAEFADLPVRTVSGPQAVLFHANLTNTMENSSFVELSLTIVGAELA